MPVETAAGVKWQGDYTLLAPDEVTPLGALNHCRPRTADRDLARRGARGKKTKRMQMRLTACNPAANFEPFLGDPASAKNET
jgi:hypothetical protein